MRDKAGGVIAILIGVFLATVPTAILFLGVTFLFFVPLILGIVAVGLGVRAYRTDPPDWLSRHVRAIALALLVLSLTPFGLLYYANLPGKPIHLIIPDGFRGPIAVVLDEEHGSDVPIVDGKHMYSIPADGILRVRTFEPFHQWHVASASFANGTAIPTRTPEGTIRLSTGDSGGTSSNGKKVDFIYFFIGIKPDSMTQEAYNRAADAAGDELLRRRVLEAD